MDVGHALSTMEGWDQGLELMVKDGEDLIPIARLGRIIYSNPQGHPEMGYIIDISEDADEGQNAGIDAAEQDWQQRRLIETQAQAQEADEMRDWLNAKGYELD